MDEGLDTGPILLAREERILPFDTFTTLHDRLAQLGGSLIVPALRGLLDGSLRPTAQDGSKATVCRTIPKEAGRIDWTRPAVEIERQVRALVPWPGTLATVRRGDGVSTDLAILRAAASVSSAAEPVPRGPGALVIANGSDLVVRTGRGDLRLLEVKPAGKGAMDAASFLRGARLVPGDCFV